MSNEEDYGIYLVTDPVLCGARGVVETVRLAVDGGVHTVQLRDKHASFDQQLSQLEQLAVVIDGRAKLVINDRLDVAVEAQRRGIAIDGVHLGQGDEAVRTAPSMRAVRPPASLPLPHFPQAPWIMSASVLSGRLLPSRIIHQHWASRALRT